VGVKGESEYEELGILSFTRRGRPFRLAHPSNTYLRRSASSRPGYAPAAPRQDLGTWSGKSKKTKMRKKVELEKRISPSFPLFPSLPSLFSFLLN